MPADSSWKTPVVDPEDNILKVFLSSNETLLRLNFLSFAFISISAFDKIVRVFKPKKSNLTKPAFSTNFMLNWVAGISSSLNL